MRASLRPAQARLPTRRSRSCTVRVVAARKIRNRKQVACSRTLIAKPGHEKEVEKLAADILVFSEQELASPAKGIVAYQCVRDAWEPNTFHFWERYEDTQSFGDHSTGQRMIELMTQLAPHLERPIGVSLYTYEDGRIGPASMQDGPKGEGGLDDATGASGAAGGASYKQTSRAFDLTKVDEHEEASRERQLIEDMQGGAAAPGQQQQQEQQQQQQQKDKEKARGPQLPLQLPSAEQVVKMAAGLKDCFFSVMGSILRR